MRFPFLRKKKKGLSSLESFHNIQNIVEGALDAIIVMNSDGLIVLWNRQSENIFGWSSKETVGKRMSEVIIPHRYREAHEKGLEKFLATGVGPIPTNRPRRSAFFRLICKVSI